MESSDCRTYWSGRRFSSHKSITICYIDFTKSAGLKKLMSKIFFLLFLKTLQCLQLSTFGRKTDGGFGHSILASPPMFLISASAKNLELA